MGSEKSGVRGIELRKGVNSESIRIKFMYRGMECRETLKLPHTKANIRYAERLRGEILNAIELGNFSYAKYFPDSAQLEKFGIARLPHQVLMDELLLEQISIAKRTLSPNTAKAYESNYKTHLGPKWGAMRLSEVTPVALRTWIAGLACKARTVNQILIPLRGALEQAINDDLIENNPMDRVRLSRVLEKESRKVEFEADPFSAEEIEAILAASAGQERNVWQFAFATGMRPSEYIALRWSSIDWLKMGVRVERTRVATVFKDETKTKSGRRTIALRNAAVEALIAQKPHTALANDLVFHDPRYGVGWKSYDSVGKRWAIVLRKAGVRFRNSYQTRHTFASTLLSTGENPMYVAKQMGHKNVDMIVRTYGKWVEQADGVLPHFYRLASERDRTAK